MNHFRMLRTFSYVLSLIGWLKLAAGTVLAVLVFWQPKGMSIAFPHLLGSATVTALAIFVLGVFLALLFLAWSEQIVWMITVNEHLQKIQKIEEFFAKAK